MAYRQTGYQYETSPRKLKPEYEPKKNPYSKKKKSDARCKKQKRQEKKSIKPQIKTVIYILIGFSILFAISYRNSLITENFNRKEKYREQLSILQKENAQIEISIQNSLNLNNIEKSASSILGMKKVDESQKVYVSLPKKDYVEPASEQVLIEEDETWFEQLINTVTSWIK